MTSWNNNLEWLFSPLGNGPKVGVNEAGIGIFKKHKYLGLAKEIIQNVLDAKDVEVDGPARACFEITNVNRKDIPGHERLLEVINLCSEYYNDGDDGEKMRNLRDAANKLLAEEGVVPVLKISDYNTIGLTGVTEEKGSNWTGLVREVGASNKSHGKSGSFGVGKFAPFNFSSIRTIIYSTLNKDGETAVQGKTILTAFRDKDYLIKHNVGLFGHSKNGDTEAIYDFSEVPEIYRREKTGTDIFVLGVKRDPDWMQQIAVTVLDLFFYAIYKNDLEVVIREDEKEIIINAESLPKQIPEYKDYCDANEIEFSAPIYWEVLKNESGKVVLFKEDFEGMGELELYLLMDTEFYDRRILEMRNAGMKIQEDTGFRLGASFRGILIATGNGAKSDNPEDNINSFLRKCENQAHDTWSKDEYENHEKEAEKILKKLHLWLVDKVKSLIPETESQETDAYGLKELLPNQFSESDENEEELAYEHFEPLPLEVAAVKVKSGTRKVSDISVSVSKETGDAGHIVIPTEDGDDLVTGGIAPPKEPHPPYPPYPGPFPGPFPGPDVGPQIDGTAESKGDDISVTEGSQKGKKTLHSISLSNIKTPYDVQNASFIVSFIPRKTCKNALLRIRIGSDDDDRKNAEVIAATYNGTPLDMFKQYIKFSEFEKGKKVVIKVQLKNMKRCPLEVTAYAE